jgi:hypothetical protein
MIGQIINMQQSSKSDELVYFAKYSTLRLLFSWLINALGVYLLITVSISLLREGKYINGFLWLLMTLAILFLFLDSILLRGLYFYKDRVVKVWKFGGNTTIYYTAAKVYGPPNRFKWLTSSYTIRATKNNGKVSFLQVPIQYVSFFFSSTDANNVNKIINYLTESELSNPRIMKTYFLNSEVLH